MIAIFHAFTGTPGTCFFSALVLVGLAGSFAIPGHVGRPRVDAAGNRMSGPDGEIPGVSDLWGDFCMNWQANTLLIVALAFAFRGLALWLRSFFLEAGEGRG